MDFFKFLPSQHWCCNCAAHVGALWNKINWFTIEMPPQFNFFPLSFCNWINKTVVPVISQDILFCITNITEVMEIRLQYILHFLGSNVSNNSLVQLNSNTCKSRIFFFFLFSHRHTLGKMTNAQRGKAHS